MSDDNSITRQRERDAEYLAACKAAGIKPDAPSYFAPGIVIETEAADCVGRIAGPKKNGSTIRTRADDPEPLKELTPEAEAAGRVIDLLVPLKSGATEFVRTAGRRALALAWLLGRRPEPLAELARQLGISRSSLSTFVRTLEKKTGVHGRGQKRSVHRGDLCRECKTVMETSPTQYRDGRCCRGVGCEFFARGWLVLRLFGPCAVCACGRLGDAVARLPPCMRGMIKCDTRSRDAHRRAWSMARLGRNHKGNKGTKFTTGPDVSALMPDYKGTIKALSLFYGSLLVERFAREPAWILNRRGMRPAELESATF